MGLAAERGEERGREMEGARDLFDKWMGGGRRGGGRKWDIWGKEED